MMKALIAGGAGFIGTHLARELLRLGYQVDLADNFSRAVRDKDLEQLAAQPNARLIECDLLQQNSWDGFSNDYNFIFHLAALIGVARVLERPYEVLTQNFRMTEMALGLARRQKNLKRFLFASTSEVYAGTLEHFSLPVPTPENTPITLSDLSHPRSSYMISKLNGEALCHHSGVPFTIFRFHNLYGPRMGMAHVVPELMDRARRLQAGEALEVYSPDHQRAFCFITDAVQMVRLASEAETGRNQTLNIGNQDEEIQIRDLAKKILEVTGHALQIRDKGTTPGSPARRCPDMSLTLKVTGFSPRVSLREGLQKTWDWYQENIFSGKEVSAK